MHLAEDARRGRRPPTSASALNTASIESAREEREVGEVALVPLDLHLFGVRRACAPALEHGAGAVDRDDDRALLRANVIAAWPVATAEVEHPLAGDRSPSEPELRSVGPTCRVVHDRDHPTRSGSTGQRAYLVAADEGLDHVAGLVVVVLHRRATS